MSEYCHHCGTTISEDIATLCPLCASKPDSLRREEIDEFAAWEKNFVKPIGREMKKRGIAYMVMILREDGKLAYVLDKEIPENTELTHPEPKP